MALKRQIEQPFESTHVIGGLLSTELLTRLRETGRNALPGRSEAEYGIPKGLKFNEELGRYWRIAQSLWQNYRELAQRQDYADHESQKRLALEEWLIPLLQDVFCYRPEPTDPITIGERYFPITHFANKHTLPFVLCGADQDLDKSDAEFGQKDKKGDKKRSPTALAQEYLNAEEQCLWAIVANGLYLRLLRDNPAITRPAYIEVDFARIFDEEDYAEFTIVWLLLHQSRTRPLTSKNVSVLSVERCWLEKWREKGKEEGERAKESLRYGVEHAMESLGTGFLSHSKNQRLRDLFTNGQLDEKGFHNQIQRLAYRFLFLLVAEDRDIALLPQFYQQQDYRGARELYQKWYSVSHFRKQARLRSCRDSYGDAWRQLLVTFKGFAVGQPLLAQPALGGIFALDQCPDLDQCELENKYLYEALFNLCFFVQHDVLRPVNYRDMDTTEFGSVYESLLELMPQINVNGVWRFCLIKSKGDKKELGTYYTPENLVQELIKSALKPVIENRLKNIGGNPSDKILSITICDPACGSGHCLIAAAKCLAAELVRYDTQSRNSELQHRIAMRKVIQKCIYGVDINNMAIELCKIALWLESVEPGKPLSFLDSHIKHGNSLVGILTSSQIEKGIPDEAFQPLTRDDKSICPDLKNKNKKTGKNIAISLRTIGLLHHDLEELCEDTLEEVSSKESRYKKFENSESYLQEKLKEDLFTASFFIPKTFETKASVPTNEMLHLFSHGENLPPETLQLVQKTAKSYHFFHWPLAFPNIFGDKGRGGFDVVIGNAPWNVSQLSEDEYFAVDAPSITNLSGAKRKKAIQDLEVSNPDLWNRFQIDKHKIESHNQFYRFGGRNKLTAKGKINLYALFAELFATMINSTGRAAMISPTGIVTDDSTKLFFSWLTSQKILAGIYDFENRKKLFPAVDSRIKFCVLSIGHDIELAKLAFFLEKTEQTTDTNRVFTLSSQDFNLINPNTKTCPVFRSQMDCELTKKIYKSAPVLIKEETANEPEVNHWGVRFSQGLFNMTSKSDLFKEYSEIIDEGGAVTRNIAHINDHKYLPLYEAKMVHHYDHRWATYEIDGKTSRDCTLAEKQNPNYHSLPRYWVAENEVTLRTTRAPKAVLDAIKKQDAEKLDHTLRLWAAGSYIETHPDGLDSAIVRGLLQDARSSDDNDLYDDTYDHRAINTACLLAKESMLSNEEVEQLVANLNRSQDPFSFIWPLLEARRPKYLLGWRDITNATNERTVIAGVIPLSAVGNNMPLAFVSETYSAKHIAALTSNLSSLPLDFVARHKVGGTHLNFFIFKQLPVLSPEQYETSDLEYIVPRVLELTYSSYNLKPFAEDMGYNGPPFKFDPERRHLLKSELDAYYAKLYGLTRDELRYILDPADVMGEDYPSETFRVLKKNEMKAFGEYRTRRLVLEAWDRLG
ncbi:Type II restriction enzyme, methylase subunit [Hahella chejuensis KCTC 2396]|uniref:site-specific DNA-methyltransferase (adenine-specific) n=1 Tax=Hahella chejuensis (strain KCTC 2396) TaxID=349521 RepID=Q2SFN7_HAHCH|nr:N-6 DNA methylase [Hahella chejuensis]ABC30537.1 Type II restriction enzyme, methylase subunit [Hahella chejuensis KCTC 2396]